MAAGDEVGAARAVRASEPLGLGDARRQVFPADHAGDRGERVAVLVPGGDERVAEAGEQAHLVIDRALVADERRLLAPFGANEEPSHQPVEQPDRVVGEAHRRVEHGGDEDRAAPLDREGGEMLRGEPRALAGELA